MKILAEQLKAVHRKGYKAYKCLQGQYAFSHFIFTMDHIQGDPFAEPSRCRFSVDINSIDLPQSLYDNRVRRIALEDYIGRRVSAMIKNHVQGKRGSGKSGLFFIAPYGQQVLQRNTVLIQESSIEVRLQIGLPANGRSCDGDQASKMLLEELPAVVAHSTLNLKDDIDAIKHHIDTVEDQHHLREQLAERQLIGFISNGAILPRASGIDDKPLADAIAFQGPPSLNITLHRLHAQPITGMGIPRGISLIVGGGFHGKSTLLQSIERGVYNHIPGDGRECVVTEPSAVKIRAEDGRAINGVDISLFINNLPQNKDTKNFSTQNASGSTSQAANIMEAMAWGTNCLLIDEDTSATNFMIRDARMQALVSKEKEPITPLVQRVHDLYKHEDLSQVIVMGGSGDFFSHADTVIMMDNYIARDVTRQAHKLALPCPTMEENTAFQKVLQQPRNTTFNCLDPKSHNGKEKIQSYGAKTLRYADEEIDVSRVEQLVDNAQLLCIGYLLRQVSRRDSTEARDLVTSLRQALTDAEDGGIDQLTPYIMGNLAMPRLAELCATANRLRTLIVLGEDSSCETA